jgi:hypothetical protein
MLVFCFSCVKVSIQLKPCGGLTIHTGNKYALWFTAVEDSHSVECYYFYSTAAGFSSVWYFGYWLSTIQSYLTVKQERKIM